MSQSIISQNRNYKIYTKVNMALLFWISHEEDSNSGKINQYYLRFTGVFLLILLKMMFQMLFKMFSYLKAADAVLLYDNSG